MSQILPKGMHPKATAPEKKPLQVSRPWGEKGHEVAGPVVRDGAKFNWLDGTPLGWEPTAWMADHGGA